MDGIRTIYGNRFDYRNIRSNKIELKDIIYSLSRINRYIGHSSRAITVAEHTVLVHDFLDNEKQPISHLVYSLFHDAEEAYTGDMPRPLKELFPDFCQLGNDIRQHILDSFYFSWPITPELLAAVNQADDLVLAFECRSIPMIDAETQLTERFARYGYVA